MEVEPCRSSSSLLPLLLPPDAGGAGGSGSFLPACWWNCEWHHICSSHAKRYAIGYFLTSDESWC